VTLIVVPDDFPNYLTGTPAEARLRALGDVTLYNRDAPRDAEVLIRRCADAEIVYNVYGTSRFTETVLAALKRLRLISRPGTGVDGVDLDACRRRGVAVANLRGNDADEIAEHAIALMLNALRRIPEMDRALRAGHWSLEMIRGARGLTLGVVGMGAIGSRTAVLGRALGMDVLAWSFGPDEGRVARAGGDRGRSRRTAAPIRRGQPASARQRGDARTDRLTPPRADEARRGAGEYRPGRAG